MKQFNVAIIGLGNISLKYDLSPYIECQYLSHCKSFHHSEHFNILFAVDPTLSGRSLFQKYYPYPVFSSIEEVDANLQPDGFIIAVPTNLHKNIVSKICLLYSPSFILCEKPLSLSLSDSQAILDLCSTNNIRLYVNYMRRCLPSSQQIKSILSNQFSDNVLIGQCLYTKGFLNNCSHFINLLEYWLGSVLEIEQPNIFKLPSQFSHIEPTFSIYFSNAKVTFIPLPSTISYAHNHIELYSSRHKLSYSRGGQDIQVVSCSTDNLYPSTHTLNSSVLTIPSDLSLSQMYVTKCLYDSLVCSSSTICTGEQAHATLELLSKLSYAYNV